MRWAMFLSMLFHLVFFQACGQDISSFQSSYSSALSVARNANIKDLPGFREGNLVEASLRGSGNFEDVIQERMLSDDPAVYLVRQNTQERKYFTIGSMDPILTSAREPIRDPTNYLQSGTFIAVEDKTTETRCEEGRLPSKVQCTEEPWMEITRRSGKHSLTLYFYGYEYWGYIIQADIFQKGRGCNNPANGSWKSSHWAEVVEGKPFPKEKKHFIKAIKATVREVFNTPHLGQERRKLTDFWQHFSYDQQGNISLGSPHNIHGVFEGYVDVEIDYEPWPEVKFQIEPPSSCPQGEKRVVYEELEKKLVKGRGCKHLQEKVKNGQCKVVSQTILEGPGTKEVEGEKITLEWWLRRLTFECFGNSISTCKTLRDRGCYQTRSICKTKQEGVCVLWEQTYLCPTEKKTKTIQMQGETFPGADEGFSYGSNRDMNDAVAKLQILKEVQTDIHESQDGLPNIFRGSEGKCTIAFGSFKNCCFKNGGWGVDMNLVDCTGEEKDLALKRSKDRCVEVGTYCAEKKPIIGCIRKKKSYCCFPSKLSRLVHKQGRTQLNIGWGDPQHPNCRGLTVEELAQVDFDKLDMSEMVSDIQQRMKPMGASGLHHRLTDRLTGMIGPFKEGEKNL